MYWYWLAFAVCALCCIGIAIVSWRIARPRYLPDPHFLADALCTLCHKRLGYPRIICGANCGAFHPGCYPDTAKQCPACGHVPPSER
jgi:hypothetical protein